MTAPSRPLSAPTAVGVAAVVVLAAAFPALFGQYPVKLLQEILIWGMFAMSLDLLMGHAGLVSFGHSAFFGIGGYVAALLIGALSVRVTGVYFIMLTLAFSQMFYAYAFQVAWLGAEDGLVGVPRPSVLGLDTSRAPVFHGYVLGLAAGVALLLRRVVRSPFGHVLRGIHENEGRMEAIGYAVARYKLLAFVLFVLLAPGGIVGALRGRVGVRA